MPVHPRIFILSAPSGAGKTSLARALMQQLRAVDFSVSHTTRAARNNEQHGRDYHFVSTREFEHMIDAGDFVEYAQVFDHWYGTSRQAIETVLQRQHHVLLDIDWQGAMKVRKVLPDAISIFIVPPSLEALRERLVQRGQDSTQAIERRMSQALSDMAHQNEYDHILINDDFKTAVNSLQQVITAAASGGKSLSPSENITNNEVY